MGGYLVGFLGGVKIIQNKVAHEGFAPARYTISDAISINLHGKIYQCVF